MTNEQNGEATDKMLNDIIRDADEYYAKLRGQHINQTWAHAAVIGSVVWFAVFAALGIGAYFTVPAARLFGTQSVSATHLSSNSVDSLMSSPHAGHLCVSVVEYTTPQTVHTLSDFLLTAILLTDIGQGNLKGD